jgi:hypothetical protein
MKTLLPAIMTLFMCVSSLEGRDPDWFKRRSNDLENSINIQSKDDRIEALGRFMSIASHGGMDEEQKTIFNKAQAVLLSIPGHAQYYQQKIEKMRSDLLEISKKNPLEVIKMQQEGIAVIDEPNYLSDTESTLRTLQYMPSAETVSVLGHFLNDPEGRDGKTLLGNPRHRPGDDFPPRASNAEVATDVIRELGIEHPPFKERGVITAEEIDAWKDWWNEVKDGKRTYRFIGSNIEYGPDGPASKEATQRAERNQKRDAERASGSIKGSPTEAVSVETKKSPLSITGIAAGLAVLLSIIGIFVRRKLMNRA